MTLQANFATHLPDVAQRKSVRLISGRPRYRHSPSGPIAHFGGVANWSSVRLIIEGKQVQFLSPPPI